jgi:NAD(P)H-hydrate epimerase
MQVFNASTVKDLYRPDKNSNGEDNGQVTIIGGSYLFHGPPFLSIQAASRVVDMVFFTSPYEPLRNVVANLKSRISSFIWVPFEEVEDYVKKSDAVLLGPGFMRAHTEEANQEGDNSGDHAYYLSRSITENLLTKFPDKKWVIDAGSLQVMDPEWIPKNAIVTPNKKEYKMLFGSLNPKDAASQYNCIIVLKGPITYVYSPDEITQVHGGNAGMTKGGTGDVMAGLTVALLAKNEPILAASVAAYVTKAAGDNLHTKKGVYFNADDLAEEIPNTLARLLK